MMMFLLGKNSLSVMVKDMCAESADADITKKINHSLQVTGASIMFRTQVD